MYLKPENHPRVPNLKAEVQITTYLKTCQLLRYLFAGYERVQMSKITLGTW